MKDKPVIVIGHKNPDTDSVCSAIAYAALKEKITGQPHVAKAAGALNEETQYVLQRFGVEPPETVTTVAPMAEDVGLQRVEGVSENISLKEAWSLLRGNTARTLPVVKGRKLQGLITTSDIARSYMDEHDAHTLAMANTPYRNILDTLEGTLVCGDEDAYFSQGKVVIAAANPDVMEEYIEEHDMVILGNRYESQLCAIEMKAGCIVVCLGAQVSMTIQKLARESGCAVIVTPFDTYTVARLITQSIPVGYFMKRDNLVTFDMDDYVSEIRSTMTGKRYRSFPVLDENGNYVGLIGRANLLDMEMKKVIMVDHNEKDQAVDGIGESEVLEIIDHHRLGSIETMNPVFFRNQPLGSTSTIIYQMYLENGVMPDPTIAALMCSAVISDTLMFRSPTCTPVDEQAARELAQIACVEIEDLAEGMFAAGSNFSGKSEEEIFYQDYKKYTAQDLIIGVGQVSSMSREELVRLGQRLLPFMQRVAGSSDNTLLLFMLTDIGRESTRLLYCGKDDRRIVMDAFGTEPEEEGCVVLPGVVSRKKQLMPAVLRASAQEQ